MDSTYKVSSHGVSSRDKSHHSEWEMMQTSHNSRITEVFCQWRNRGQKSSRLPNEINRVYVTLDDDSHCRHCYVFSTRGLRFVSGTKVRTHWRDHHHGQTPPPFDTCPGSRSYGKAWSWRSGRRWSRNRSTGPCRSPARGYPATCSQGERRSIDSDTPASRSCNWTATVWHRSFLKIRIVIGS